MKQKTIKNSISLEGVGLHTGHKAHVKFNPAGENSGILFSRVDLAGKPVIRANYESVLPEGRVPRCTTIGNSSVMIHTVEHVMSALCGLGITNLSIEIDNDELPGLDGSSLEYLNAFKKAGVLDQGSDAQAFRIQEPVGVEHNGSSIYVMPADDFRVAYTLDYHHSYLKSQYYSLTVTPESFEKEIAPCRTFCLEEEAQELQRMGLGKGANHENTLVIGKNGVIKNQMRFENEFARHKVLDCLGDLYLLGVPIRGHIFAVKSGHALNVQLLKKILEQKEWFERKGLVGNFDLQGKKEIGINEIMKILPHRYPFLLVDRVIEIEKGKKAIGIKNVTMNDNFFQGHFPTRPVMPGVMMVEAMAQTAGVVVLTNEEHHGKVAFFLAADNVKFRKVVTPGDQLVMEVEVVRDKSKTAQIHAQATVDGQVVAEADMVFSFTDASYLD